MRQDVDITNFTAGELSSRMKGRIDVAKYFNGADTMLNMVTMPQGGATKRPATTYVANQKDQANPCRLRRFIFSTVQAYMLELSNLNARIYMNDAPVLNAGNPVDVVTPYTTADLKALKFTQSADTLFIWHPKYPPAILTRSSHVNWTYTPIAWRDGPYEDVNTTTTTLTPSAVSGAITITASAVTGINNNQGFLASDVGRLIRIKVAALWGWVLITARADATHVSATVQPACVGIVNGANGVLDGTAATGNWRMGRWSATTGYPYAPSFWQQRLMSAGYDGAPNIIVGSVPGDFTNMAPTAADGTVTAAHAISWIIDDDQVNAIRALSPAGSAQAMQLGIFTGAGEQIMQAASTAEALTPTSVQAYRETAYGSADNVEPLRIGKAVLFVDRPGRKIREWAFYWQVNGYNGPDLTQFSEHITRAPAGADASLNGIAQMVYQQAPYQIVWAIRKDGQLLGFTYDRDQSVFAPHRHQLGGNYYGGPPVVESIDVIPSPDGTYDELWLSVLRTVGGTVKRFIEVMTSFFDGDAQDNAFFSDAGLSSALTFPAASLTITGLLNSANAIMPAAFTGTATLVASANVFSAASVGAIVRVNAGKLLVSEYDDPKTVKATVFLNSPLSNMAPAAQNAWSCTLPLASYSGMGHLNGEQVAILGDGAVFDPQTIVAGAFTLSTGKASLVNAGLAYAPVIVTMPWEPVRAAGIASQGKMKRVDTLWVRFHESLGCSFGRVITDEWTATLEVKLEPLESRGAADPMSQAPPLYSGIKRLEPQGDYDREGQIVITQTEPLPLTVLAIFARADVAETVPV